MTENTTDTEQIIEGISANSGIAIGEVFCVNNKRPVVLQKVISNKDVDKHIALFADARETLVEELKDLVKHLDTESSAIIETQKQIIQDPEIEKRVNKIIQEELLSSEFAVYKTFCDFIERLKESGSELFQQRIIDLEKLRDRLLELVCEDGEELDIPKGAILITKELSPVELVAYHEKGISGVVMEKSGITAHAALISQSLGIPCLVNTKHATSKAKKGLAILDGREGKLILDPADSSLSEYKEIQKKIEQSEERFLQVISKPSETKNGTEFQLSANIEFESELDSLKKYDIQHIGLLRTEGLLFSGKTGFNEQAKFYESVLKSVSGSVTFRLFDVGGDKLSSKIPEEANPFLGWRGIRMLLDEDELLRTQLKALLICAGKHPGRVKILVPMISIQEEIITLKDIIQEVQSEVEEKGNKIDENVEIGAMIEVPSAALNAEKLASHLDFLSIGTNDLTQYTLAVDRGNEKICSLYQQQHPALWSLIKITADAAQATQTPLAVCGELAGNRLGACGLVGLGINKLSMISNSIPKVKEELINHTDEEFKQLSKQFIDASTIKEVKEIFEDWRNK